MREAAWFNEFLILRNNHSLWLRILQVLDRCVLNCSRLSRVTPRYLYVSTLASVWPSIFTTGTDGFLAYVKSIDLVLLTFMVSRLLLHQQTILSMSCCILLLILAILVPVQVSTVSSAYSPMSEFKSLTSCHCLSLGLSGRASMTHIESTTRHGKMNRPTHAVADPGGGGRGAPLRGFCWGFLLVSI